VEHNTANQYRDGIRTLLIEYLGIRWARRHILPHGGLLAVPVTELPALYARAQADAEAVLDALEATAPQGDGCAGFWFPSNRQS
jgi:hypothetical protein